MAVTQTTRFSLTQWSSGDDEFSREQVTQDNLNVGDNAAIFLSGTSATPPTAADDNTKAFYWDKTNSILYYRGDVAGASPAAWAQIHPVVAADHTHTTLQPIDADLTALSALSGTGVIARTADNTYALRTISVSGSGISISNAGGIAGNPSISLNSTSDVTASTLVYRDSNSQFKIGTPTDNEHPTTKSYVDTALGLKANSSDVYTKSDIEGAKLYQYANEAGGTGGALPSSGTRSTPRIYVQSTEPSSSGAITGDIWFQI